MGQMLNNVTCAVAAADEQQCEEGWTKFQGNCYLHFSDRETWLEAEQRCRDLNAHLASIITPEEQAFVNGELRARMCVCVGVCVSCKEVKIHVCLFSHSKCPELPVDRAE